MSHEHQASGPSVGGRQLVYACARLGQHAAERIEGTFESSPGRQPRMGGLRGYQPVRPPAGPNKRSLQPPSFGHTLHIDASELDVRFAPDLPKQMPAQKSKFYVGLDGATGMLMAHVRTVGPARTDGMAILLREYVRECGRQLADQSVLGTSGLEDHGTAGVSPSEGLQSPEDVAARGKERS